MPNRIAALVAAIAFVLASASTAHAFRPVPGYDYPDLCKNRGPYALPGEQNIGDILMARVAYVDPSQEPNKLGRRACVVVDREKG